MSATEKVAGPVTPQELEDLALRIAQATSNLDILANASEVGDGATLHSALALVVDYLEGCTSELSELHRRHLDGQP